MFPASGNFTTTLGSAATASNTLNFFASVPTNLHSFYCVTVEHDLHADGCGVRLQRDSLFGLVGHRSEYRYDAEHRAVRCGLQQWDFCGSFRGGD